MSSAMTVRGPVPAGDLGHVQLHEHLLCDLSLYVEASRREDGEDITLANYTASRLERDNPHDMRLDSVPTAIEELAHYRQAGGATLVDATPRGLGRRPADLRRISEASGVHVVMGTGWYAAPFHSPRVAHADDTELVDSIITDLTDGDPETGVRAGIIGEIGMSWPPHPDEVRVLRAAARASAQTGASILVHPGRHRTAPLAHVQQLLDDGAAPEAIVMSHIDRTLFSIEEMRTLADTGCVLEFDLFGTESSYYPPDLSLDLPNDAQRVRYIAELIDHGYRDQIAIAEDVCRKTQLRTHGGEGYDHVLRRVIPLMLRRGLSRDDVKTITRDTPTRLLAHLP
jgi:phosphotriesterase-related protein